jgi:hypothetical protein
VETIGCEKAVLMIRYSATIKQFSAQGEKTGWTYIEVPAALARQLKDDRKGFRVKGKLDEYSFEMLSLLPMGEGNFILTLKAGIRKAIRKRKGDTVKVQMEMDAGEITAPAALTDCLEDDPDALKKFQSMPRSHQHYFINWINNAKTVETQAKRIAHTVNAMLRGWDFGQMLRAIKKEKEEG